MVAFGDLSAITSGMTPMRLWCAESLGITPIGKAYTHSGARGGGGLCIR